MSTLVFREAQLGSRHAPKTTLRAVPQTADSQTHTLLYASQINSISLTHDVTPCCEEVRSPLPQLCVLAHFRQSEHEDSLNSTDSLGEQNGTEGDT